MRTIAHGSFEDITAGLPDVAAAGDQIVAGSEYDPFGVELLTPTPESALKLGALACVKKLYTGETIDDDGDIITPSTDNGIKMPIFDQPPEDITALY